MGKMRKSFNNILWFMRYLSMCMNSKLKIIKRYQPYVSLRMPYFAISRINLNTR